MAFPNGWTGYVEFVLPSGKTNYTFLVFEELLNHPEAAAACLADGADLRVTDEDNNLLAVDIIRFDSDGNDITDTAIAVRYPGVTTSVSTLRIWFGDATATLPAADSEFGQYNAYGFNYLAFYPDGLGDDRTSNQLDLTAVGSPTVAGQAGPIAGSLATDLNGSSQYGIVTLPDSLVAPLRVSAQTRPDANVADMFAVTIGNDTTTTNYWALGLLGTQTGDPIGWISRNTSSRVSLSGTFVPGQWNHAAGREVSTGSRYGYYNATEGEENTASSVPSSNYLTVGVRGGTSFQNYYNGLISMVAVVLDEGSAQESADWYEMIHSPETFYGESEWVASTPGEPPINTDGNPPELIGAVAMNQTVGYNDGGWDGGTTTRRVLQLAADDDGAPADEWTEIPNSGGTSFELTFADVEPDQWIRLYVRRANDEGSTTAYSQWYQISTVAAATVGSVNSFEFVRRLINTEDVPALSGTGVGPYFFRTISLTYLRDQGMTLHADLDAWENIGYGSSDHMVGTGKIWGAVFNNIADGITVLPTAIHTGTNQRETPHPVYDPIGERLLLCVHDNNSNGLTENQQHLVVLESTDGMTFTVANSNPCNYGNHTGYPQAWYDAVMGKFYCMTLMAGGEQYWFGFHESDDGETFTLVDHYWPNINHILGPGKCLTGAPYLKTINGEYYFISMLETRQASGLNGTAQIALPIFYVPGQIPRFKGGYFVLCSVGESLSDPNYILQGDLEMFENEGETYLTYSGRDGFGNQSILLYRMTDTEATYQAPLIQPNGNGRIRNPPKRTTVIDWDAANDALPAEITISATSGTNNSSQSAGNYYHFGTGSGSAQDVILALTDQIDITAHEAVEFTIEGFQLNAGPATAAQSHLVAFLDWKTNAAGSWASQDGFIWFSSNNHRGGSYRSMKNNGIVAGSNVNSHAFGINDGTTALCNYIRSLGVDLTFKFYDFGAKFCIQVTPPGKNPLVDAQTTFYRDLSDDDLDLTAGIFTLRLVSATPFPETWMRFTGLSVYLYDDSTVQRAGVGTRFLEPVLIG